MELAEAAEQQAAAPRGPAQLLAVGRPAAPQARARSRSSPPRVGPEQLRPEQLRPMVLDLAQGATQRGDRAQQELNFPGIVTQEDVAHIWEFLKPLANSMGVGRSFKYTYTWPRPNDRGRYTMTNWPHMVALAQRLRRRCTPSAA